MCVEEKREREREENREMERVWYGGEERGGEKAYVFVKVNYI